MARLIDLKGKTFGDLLVLERDLSFIGGVRWICLCSCGKTKSILAGHLASQKIKSCGCLNSRLARDRATSHGLCKSLTYGTWRGMKERCLRSGRSDSNSYFEKGIGIDEKWMSFDGFYEDMGERPGKEYCIDRIDNNKPYSKDNCRWVLHSENCQNTSVSKRWTVDGVEYLSIAEAAKTLSVSHATIQRWCKGYINNGKTIPPKNGCSVTKFYKEEE